VDPDEVLRLQRDAAQRIFDCTDGIYTAGYLTASNVEELFSAATKLAETQRALDEWMQKGGFPPTDWRR